MKRALTAAFILFTLCILLAGCMSTKSEGPSYSNHITGYGILERLPGQWHGPVTTTTPAGNFPEWDVDFRPVSLGQVSQYSSLDADIINYLSFSILKRDDELKIALHTEGCVTYEVIDKVDEEKGYFRFSDFKSKDERAYTEFHFKKDSFMMEVYTNRFDLEPEDEVTVETRIDYIIP